MLMVDSEAALLSTFIDAVKSLDPDLLLGWHVEGFDLRARLGIPEGAPVILSVGRESWAKAYTADDFWQHLSDWVKEQILPDFLTQFSSQVDEIIEQIEPLGLEGYDKSKIESQLRQDQQDRLQAELDVKYKSQKELSEFVLTGSIVCISMGGTIFSWYLYES